jgi:hypothetical protein
MYQLVVEVNNSSAYIKVDNDVFTKDTRVSIFDNASDQFIQSDGSLKVETCALEVTVDKEDSSKLYFTETLSRSIYPDTNIKIVIESPNRTFRNITWPTTMGNEVKLSLELVGQTDEETLKNAREAFDKGDLDNSEALLAQISDNEYPGVAELIEKIKTKRQDSGFFKKASDAYGKGDLDNCESLLLEMSDKQYSGRTELLEKIKHERSLLAKRSPEIKTPGSPSPSRQQLNSRIPLWAYIIAIVAAILTALVIFWSYQFNDKNIYAEKIWSGASQVINIFTKSAECRLEEFLSDDSLTLQKFNTEGEQILSNCILKTSKLAVIKEIERIQSAWAYLIVGHLYDPTYEHPTIEKKLGLVASEPVSVTTAIEYYKRAKDLRLINATKYLNISCRTIKENSVEELLVGSLCD